MKETITRRYPDGTRATYKLAPGSPHAAALLTPMKPWKIKRPKEKRQYPEFSVLSTSTAQYVREYYRINALGSTAHFDPLREDRAHWFAGVDSVEPWADEPIPALYPDPIP